jgi:hypothetical protein
MKAIAALRNQFGGHAIVAEAATGDDEGGSARSSDGAR